MNKYRVPLLGITSAFCLGIIINKYFPLLNLFAVIILSILLILSVIVRKDRIAGVLLLSALICFGFIYTNIRGMKGPGHICNFVTEAPGKAMIEGIIIDEPCKRINRFGGASVNFTLNANRLYSDDKEHAVCGLVNAHVNKEVSFYIGDRVMLEGRLERPKGPTNPGQFNYKEYLARHKIYATFYTGSLDAVKLLETKKTNFLFNFKKALIEKSQFNLTKNTSALTLGMILGERDDIPEWMNSAFTKTGTVHILAISGMNVGLLAVIFFYVFRSLNLPNTISETSVLAILIFYCLITGANAPVVRATIMAAVVIIGYLIDRESNIINSLCLACLLILLFNPMQLFDIGFQLSFIAVASIVYFMSKFEFKFESESYILKVVAFVKAAFLVSLGAWLGSAPLVAYYFNLCSPVTLLANVLIVPLVFAITVLGVAFFALSWLPLMICQPVIFALDICCLALTHVVSLSAKLPFAYFYVKSFPFYFVIIYYLLLIAVLNYERLGISKVKAAAGMLIIFNLVIWQQILLKHGDLVVTFLDVGDADAIFIELPGEGRILVDGASSSKGRNVVVPFLRSKGINYIDMVIATHPDEDHIGGLIGVFENFKVGLVLDNGQRVNTGAYLRFVKALKQNNIIHSSADTAKKISFGKTRLNILNPGVGFNAKQTTNDSSVVVRLAYKDFSIFLSGDIQKAAINNILSGNFAVKSDILKLPHHGRVNASALSRLEEAVSPEISIISGTRFGAFSTAKSGAITIATNGYARHINGYLARQSLIN